MAGGTSLGKLYFELSINDQTSKELEKIKQNIDAALKRGGSGITINEIKLSEGAANKLASEVQSKLNKIEIAVNKTQLQNSVQAALSDFSAHIKVNLIDASFWEDSGNAGKHITVNAKLADGALQQIQAQLDALKGLNINIGATATGVAVSPTATGAASSAAASASEEVKVAETKKEAAQKTAEAVEGKKKAAQKEVEVDKTYQAAIRAGIANLKKLDSAMDSIRLSLAKKGQKVHDELVKFKEERKRIYDEIAKVDGGTAALSTYRQSRLVTGNLTTMKADVAYNAKTAELDTKRFYNLLNARAAAEDMSEAQKQMVARLQAKMFLPAEKLQWQLQNKSSDAAAAGANNAGYEKSIQQIEEFQKRLLNVKSVGEALSMQPVWTQLSSNIAAATSNTDKLNKAFISNQNAVQRLATASERLYGSKIAEGKGGNSAQIAQALNELDKFNAKLKDPNLKQPISELGKEYDALKFKIKEAEVAAASQAAADRKSAAEQKQLLAARTRMYQSINAGIASYTGKKNSTAAGVDTSAYENAIRQLAAFRSQVSGLVDVSNINNVTTAFKNLEATLAADARQMEVLNKEKANIAGMSVSAQALLDKTNANNTGKQLSADMVTALQTLEAFIQKLSTSTSGAAALGQEFNKIKGDIAAASSNTNQQTRQSAQRTKLLEQLESKILSVQKRLYDLDNYSGQKGGYWAQAKNEAEALKRKLEGLRTAQDAAIRSGIGNEYKKANIEIDNYLGKQRAADAAARQTAGSQNQAANSVNRHAKSWVSLNTNMSRGGILARMNIDILGQLGNQLAMYLSVYAIERFVKGLADIHGEFQKQKIALGSILGDAAKANELFNQLKSLAVQSPYQFKDLTGFVKQLSAFSFPTDELYDMTKRLADISAGLGVDMGRVILAVGQVRSASYLRGQELRQFTEAGIPLLDELAKKFTELKGRVIDTGEVFDMISKRQVPYEMVRDIMVDLTNEGGKFYKMQEVLADTLAGKISNLTDAYNIMQDEMGKAGAGSFIGGMVDGLKAIMQNWKLISTAIKAAGIAMLLAKTRNKLFYTADFQNQQKSLTLQLRRQQMRLSEISHFRTLTAEETAVLKAEELLTMEQIKEKINNKELTQIDLIRLRVRGLINAEMLKESLIASGLTAQEAAQIANMNLFTLETKLASAAVTRLGVSIKSAFSDFSKNPWTWLITLVSFLSGFFIDYFQKLSDNEDFIDEASKKSTEAIDAIRTKMSEIEKENGGIKLDVMLNMDSANLTSEMKGKVLKAVEDMKELIKQYSPVSAQQIFDIDSIDDVVKKLQKAKEIVEDFKQMSANEGAIAEIATEHDVDSWYKNAAENKRKFDKRAKQLPEKKYAALPSQLREQGFSDLAEQMEQRIADSMPKAEVLEWLLSQRPNTEDVDADLAWQLKFYETLRSIKTLRLEYGRYQAYLHLAEGGQKNTNVKSNLSNFAEQIRSMAIGDRILDENGKILNEDKYRILVNQAWNQYAQKNTNLSTDASILQSQKEAFEKRMFGFSIEQAKGVITNFFSTIDDETEKRLEISDEKFQKDAMFKIRMSIAKPYESDLARIFGGTKNAQSKVDEYFDALQYEASDFRYYKENGAYSQEGKIRANIIRSFEYAVGKNISEPLRAVAITFNKEFWNQMEMQRTKIEFSGWRKEIAEAIKNIKPQDDIYQDLKGSESIEAFIATAQKKIKELDKSLKSMKPFALKLNLDTTNFDKYFDENGNFDITKLGPLNLSELETTQLGEYAAIWKSKKQYKQGLVITGASESTSSSSNTDKQLQTWKKQFEDLKKIYSNYKSWAKDLGREQAIKYLQESGITSEDIGDITKFDPDKMQAYMKHLTDRILKNPMTSEERKSFKNTLEEYHIQLGVDIDKDALTNALNKMKTDIDEYIDKYNIYKKLYTLTGNGEFAGKVSFGNALFGGSKSYVNDLKAMFDMNEEVKKLGYTYDELERRTKDNAFMKGVPDSVKSAFEDIKKNIKSFNKEIDELFLKVAEDYRSTSEKIDGNNIERALQLEAVAKKLKEGKITQSRANEYNNRINTEFDFKNFQQSSDYINFYSAIYSMSIEKARQVGNAIKANLDEKLRNGTISAKEYVKEMENIRKQVNELANKKSDFTTFITEGLDKMVEQQRTVAESKYNEASQRYKTASEDIAKYKDLMGQALNSGNSAEAGKYQQLINSAEASQSIAESDMAGATAMMEGADGAMQTVAIIDTIIKGINQMVQGIYDTAKKISEMRESEGYDTESGGWGDTLAFMSAFSDASNDATNAWESLKNGDIGGVISGVVGSFTSWETSLNKWHDQKLENRISESKQRVDQLSDSYERLDSIMERALGNGNDSVQRLIASYKQLAEQVSNVGASLTDSQLFSSTASTTEGFNDLIKSYKDEIAELEKKSGTYTQKWLMGAASATSGYAGVAALEKLTGLFSHNRDYTWKIEIDKEALAALQAIGTGEIQNKAGEAYRAQYASLVAQRAELEEQMRNEEAKKNTDKDAIADYSEQIADLNDQITYFVQDLAKELYSIDFDDWSGQLSDALVNAFRNGENAAEAFKETANDILATVANNMVKLNIIEPMFEELEEQLFGTVDENGNRTGGVATMENLFDAPEKVAATIKEWFNSKGEDMLSSVESFLNIFNEATGGSLTDNATNKAGLTASISGITEDTAELLASYLNAIRADVSVMRAMQTDFFLKSMPDVTATLGNQLASLKLIEANTLATANNTGYMRDTIDSMYTILKKATTSGSGVRLNI